MTDDIQDNLTEDEAYNVPASAYILAGALLVVVVCCACGALAWAVM